MRGVNTNPPDGCTSILSQIEILMLRRCSASIPRLRSG